MVFTPLAKHKSEKDANRRAKKLRKEAPLTERLLWNALRPIAKNENLRFRRQHPIHPYIVDFVCLAARLVVEVDGLSHDTRLVKDEERDIYLRKLGYDVLRFTNEDVRTNLENVVMQIVRCAKDRSTEVFIPLP